MKTDKSKSPGTDGTTDIRILKIASCLSVSGKSTLTYHIGCTPDGDIQLRVYANTAAGFFSKEWLPLTAVDQALNKAGSHFTSFALQPLFRGKSQNNTAFLLAVLLREGLVAMAADKKRCYGKLDAGRFNTEKKALIESKVSLNDDDKPAKPGKTAPNADDKPHKPAKKKAISKPASEKEEAGDNKEPDSPR
jgi:hypothetical protein